MDCVLLHEIKNDQSQGVTIQRIEDQSDENLTRLKIYFKNGFRMSILANLRLHPNKIKFEIIVFDVYGKLLTGLFEEAEGAIILRTFNKKTVFFYLQKVGYLPTKRIINNKFRFFKK